KLCLETSWKRSAPERGERRSEAGEGNLFDRSRCSSGRRSRGELSDLEGGSSSESRSPGDEWNEREPPFLEHPEGSGFRVQSHEVLWDLHRSPRERRAQPQRGKWGLLGREPRGEKISLVADRVSDVWASSALSDALRRHCASRVTLVSPRDGISSRLDPGHQRAFFHLRSLHEKGPDHFGNCSIPRREERRKR